MSKKGIRGRGKRLSNYYSFPSVDEDDAIASNDTQEGRNGISTRGGRRISARGGRRSARGGRRRARSVTGMEEDESREESGDGTDGDGEEGDDDSEEAWPHEVIPVTEEQVEETRLLRYSILADSSMKSYSNHLVSLVVFIALRNPKCLTEDVRNSLRHLDKKQWNNFLKNYITTKPRPLSPMFDLRTVNHWFQLWLHYRKKNNGGQLSFSTYNSSRSAVVALLTLFDWNTDSFDRCASTLLRSLKVKHANAAKNGEISVKRGKNPICFSDYRKIALKLFKGTTVSFVFTHTMLTSLVFHYIVQVVWPKAFKSLGCSRRMPVIGKSHYHECYWYPTTHWYHDRIELSDRSFEGVAKCHDRNSGKLC